MRWKVSSMWNRSIALPRKEVLEQDGEGFQKTRREFIKGIPANFTDVTRNDEILASQKGYTINQNVEIMACNYSGEAYVVDESTGDMLEVKRVFQKDKSNFVILSCERRKNGEI